jgi:hypothetical protein
LKLAEYKFECSHQEESVYFINNSEKRNFEDQGVVFEQQGSLFQFDFMFYNILMNPDFEENDFAYEMIAELTYNIEEYYNNNWQKKEFKIFQESLKSKLLDKINWQKATEKRIDTDKLYEFANKIAT